MSGIRFPLLLAFAATAPRAWAQPQPSSEPCARPDSVAVRGNRRVPESRIRTEGELRPGADLNFRAVQRTLKALYATGEFEDVRLLCHVDPATSRATLTLEVVERPVLLDLRVEGAKEVSPKAVRDRAEIPLDRPLNPALVTRAITRIDSLYKAAGYTVVDVRAESTVVAPSASDPGGVRLRLLVDEGRRLAVSGVDIQGNRRIRESDLVKAMKTRPEGFFWFRKGEFDPDTYAGDLGERLPKVFGERGLIDYQILSDTLIVDRERGKALVRITVDEGPRYRVGSFDVAGNHRFPTEEVQRFYPFGERDVTLRQQLSGLLGGSRPDPTVFNQSEWEEATNRLRTAYSNEGYIYAQIRPVAERVMGPDSVPTVNLRWEIDERSPATVNRIDITGNDYTTEACIRDQLVILPGDVFNQDRLVRSYQQIANMGFFETPLEPPDTRPANDKGDVDIIFKVKEKRTGNVNLGASVGQGTGVGGFIGLDQPNLFGRCKRVSLQWQFGRYINNFQLSYTDPTIRQTRISGTIAGYHTQSRFIIADVGREVRTGGSLQFGFPSRWSPYTRFFISYGGEAVRYRGGLFERDTAALAQARTCDNCFRSQIGLGVQHDTRIDLPFATAGSLLRFDASFNGGPLGGTAAFQRYTAEFRGYAPLFQLGGRRLGSQPIKFLAGLTMRVGTLFGDAGPFFVSQQFALGGVQFGEMLRGYGEFCVTPLGYDPSCDDNPQARLQSFGSAFFSTTAEFGVRVSQIIYLNAFYDAGNIWRRPRDIDPTRLFRGTGIGVSLVTPLGPLGLDWAYGLDRVDAFGRRNPKWKLHFRLGNIF